MYCPILLCFYSPVTLLLDSVLHWLPGSPYLFGMMYVFSSSARLLLKSLSCFSCWMFSGPYFFTSACLWMLRVLWISIILLFFAEKKAALEIVLGWMLTTSSLGTASVKAFCATSFSIEANLACFFLWSFFYSGIWCFRTESRVCAWSYCQLVLWCV